ncbi:MAG: proline dehydrogenase family protein [Acidobacteria bacterium]|nr:proline dehydrogenase family protein [Acidobacteriota bacterium]MBU1474824.1 proline dehydrogenase family protein [Acidobacteriota bacterium]MBU2438210.1 proline dehydrogenase family protein [Acidobacteriota bacterium]
MGIKRFVVNLAPTSLVKIFAGPYVAGDSIEAAVETAKNFWDTRKVCSTVDLLGEEIETDEEVDYTVGVYERLIEALGKQEYATISLKPTQLGSHKSTDHCRQVIEGIVARADTFDIPVTLDMEDHTFTDMTLEIFKAVKSRYPSFGTVLQSRLFRTDDDIRSIAGLEARIRICIGIYVEPKDISMTKKPVMKKKMLEQTEVLWKEGHYAEIATHDEALIEESINRAERLNLKKDRYEVQMLMGVPKAAFQDKLIAEGIKVRLYVPFAEKWKYATNYAKRRLLSNPAMALYIVKNMFQKTGGKK